MRRYPALGLCGLWYGPGGKGWQNLPWWGFYTHDYNMPMSVAALPTVGHPELAMAYIDTLYAALPLVQQEARERYGVEGAIYPLGRARRCKDVSGPLYRHCEQACRPFWGAILAAWDATLQDGRLLKTKLYPIVREVALFFTEYMLLDETTGRYRLWPTQAAEYFYLDKANPTATLTLVKRTVQFALESARRLAVDFDLQTRWESLLDRFPEYTTDRGVWTIAEGLPREHYTWSVLSWMLWPAGELRTESSKSMHDLAERTLDFSHPRRMHGWTQKVGAHEGSFGGTTMLALCELRLGNVKEARKLFLGMDCGYFQNQTDLSLTTHPYSMTHVQAIGTFPACQTQKFSTGRSGCHSLSQVRGTWVNALRTVAVASSRVL